MKFWKSKKTSLVPSISGLTLVELLLVISLFALLSMIGFGWTQIMANQRLRVATQRFSRTLHYARLQAMHRKSVVTICGGSMRCESEWGHTVWISSKGELIRKTIFPKTISIRWQAGFSSNKLQFDDHGFTDGQQGSFYLSDRYSHISSRIIILNTGSIRVDR